jgi:hypothetical protein
VVTPGFLPGFSFTVDYYDIKVEKLINNLGADFVLSQCLTTADPTYCNRVHRAGNGSIWLGDSGFVEDPILNTGSLQIKGSMRKRTIASRSAASAASGCSSSDVRRMSS